MLMREKRAGEKVGLNVCEWTKAASVSLICKINIHEFDCLERGIIYKPGSEWEP